MTTRPSRRRLPAKPLTPLLCLLSSCALALAQSAPPQSQGATARTPAPAQIVRLNVIVTDESGRAITDLKREEVSVTEDGAPQAVTHFAREELPVSYGLAVDASRSVAPLLDTLIRTGGTIASGNKPGDETFVMRFVSSDKIELLSDFTSDPDKLGEALTSIFTEGGATAVVDATYLAVKRAAERRGDDGARRRAVVLISDCDDRSSSYKQSELIDQLRRENVQVFVVSFLGKLDGVRGFTQPSQRDKARKLAGLIAAESGGRAFFPKSLDELKQAAAEISRDLRSQYVLTYAPTNANADGKFRRVEVRVADAPGGAKRKAFARPGYFAGK